MRSNLFEARLDEVLLNLSHTYRAMNLLMSGNADWSVKAMADAEFHSLEEFIRNYGKVHHNVKPIIMAEDIIHMA